MEKEVFSLMDTIERMHWIVSDPTGFDIYTDHNNLLFIFDSISIQPDLSLASVRKVLQWDVGICG